MSAPDGSAGPGRGSSLTVQGYLNLVLAIMAAVVLGGVLVAGMFNHRTVEVSQEVSNHIQPARVAAYRLQAALLDQETAIRGYVIATDPQFLQPYNDGLRVEQSAAAAIRQSVGDHAGLIADLDGIERAAAAWRAAYAVPLIAAVTAGAPNVVVRATAERGKAEFDNLRKLFDAQDAHLDGARDQAFAQLDQARRWRDNVLVAMVAAFVATAVFLTVLVRTTVIRPLRALAAACRRITDGNFAETIAQNGPKDIRGIARDVEDMRTRIVAELEAASAARARLAAQAQALDEQAAELLRSNAELEQFASVASHDLQEPLRKVAAFCQLLEKRYRDQLDERGVEYIDFAVDGAKRMQMLVNDLLTFSRVGRMHAMQKEADLDAALAGALANLAAAIEESAAEVVCPSQPLPQVTGDPTQLTMLWQNLIGNAVKFQREGHPPRIVIDYQRGAGDRDGDWVFSVADNGIGIAEDFIDKVFAVFQRLHSRDAYPGTGIGLALCKKIVEQHGGTIWIDTSYTQGCKFCFTMPIAAREVSAAVLEGSIQ